MQRDLVVGTAGHIDHGKTALVRALTGVDTDRLPAEKERGITIDLGFASLEAGGHRLAIVDVPGHERFVRNMLAGASGLDLAMLVVAADDSVMPQTREHLEILRLLDLAGGVIVLSKCDLADAGWLDLVEEEIRALVDGTFLENAAVVRTSAATGAGVDRLRDELRRLADETSTRRDPGPFRMAIDRAFTIAGHGTVVTGTVASGCVTVGDEFEWLPAGRVVRVRGLHRHDRPAERVGRGARAAINLAGVHHSEVRRGQELAAPGYLSASRVLSIEVQAARESVRELRHRSRYKLHLGTAEVSATLSLFESNAIAPGESGLAQCFLAEPVCAVHGQPLVLRQESPPMTVGGGRVLQPDARRVRRRDRASLGRLARLRSVDPAERVRAALALQSTRAFDELTLCRNTGVPVEELKPLLAHLAADGSLVELALGGRRSVRLLADIVADLEQRVLRTLNRLHGARPRLSAIPRAELWTALGDVGNESLIGALVERLAARRQVAAGPRSVALAGFEPRLSQAERRLKKEAADAIRAGRFSPPDLADLQAAAGPRAAVVPELLQLLCEEQQLVEIKLGFYLDFEAEAEMRRQLTACLSDGSPLTIAALRDRLGTTRKYAVPLGEYLDRIGFTRREGDYRYLASLAPQPEMRSDTSP